MGLGFLNPKKPQSLHPSSFECRLWPFRFGVLGLGCIGSSCWLYSSGQFILSSLLVLGPIYVRAGQGEAGGGGGVRSGKSRSSSFGGPSKSRSSFGGLEFRVQGLG